MPQDIANILAVTIRDVIWLKDSVFAFLEECAVPQSIMIEVRRMRSTPTINSLGATSPLRCRLRP